MVPPVLVTADASLTVIVAPRNAPVTSTSPSLSIVNAPAAVVVPALPEELVRLTASPPVRVAAWVMAPVDESRLMALFERSEDELLFSIARSCNG